MVSGLSEFHQALLMILSKHLEALFDRIEYRMAARLRRIESYTSRAG